MPATQKPKDKKTLSVRSVLIILLVLYTFNILYVEASLYLDNIPSPPFFALGTLFPFTIALLHASQRLGWKRMLIMLVLTFAVSLFFESVGVATGWVYGPYHYTDTHELGPKFLGLVPLFVPLGWFMMSYPSFVIADRLVPLHIRRFPRILSVSALTALAMTAWDMVMDPVRVHVGQWVWEVDGAYFGVPLQNYWGWWLTTFVTLTLFLLLSGERNIAPGNASFDRFAVAAYALIGIGEISGALVLGVSGPALAGFFAMAPWVILGWFGTGKENYR